MKTAAVILAGGAGTRLWPLSIDEKPKQFHDLTGEGTLLETTISRLKPINPDICIIATSGRYEKMSMAEIEKTGINGMVLVEPIPKNTAPTVLYSAIYLSKQFEECIMIILPADHYIKNTDAFYATIKNAINEAMNDSLVTIGIKPLFPETGYGYIKAGKASEGDGIIFKAERFVEKPNRATADKYIAEGNYFWNAGIFIWKTSAIISAFKKLMPGLYEAFNPLFSLSAADIASNENRMSALKEKIFSNIEPISIDYGIMEKAENKIVIPADIGWTDVGSWISIDGILKPDKDGNRYPGNTNPIFVSSNGCSVFSESGRVALVGVENLVVVVSEGNILVMNKNNSQEVKKVVDIVKGAK